VKALHLVRQRGQRRRGEVAAVQHGARVAHQPGHVPEQFVRRAHVRACPEIREVRGRAAKRLLRAVRQRGQEVLEQ
jgi:hypothetical protein